MCSIDFDELPTVHSTTERKARKPHKCSECCRVIAIGERYRNFFCVFEGRASTSKTCEHCCVGQDWLIENCDGYLVEGLMDEVQEHADEYPDIRFGMLRLRVGIRRKWARFDGMGLMPLPPMPRSVDMG